MLALRDIGSIEQLVDAASLALEAGATTATSTAQLAHSSHRMCGGANAKSDAALNVLFALNIIDGTMAVAYAPPFATIARSPGRREERVMGASRRR